VSTVAAGGSASGRAPVSPGHLRVSRGRYGPASSGLAASGARSDVGGPKRATSCGSAPANRGGLTCATSSRASTGGVEAVPVGGWPAGTRSPSRCRRAPSSPRCPESRSRGCSSTPRTSAPGRDPNRPSSGSRGSRPTPGPSGRSTPWAGRRWPTPYRERRRDDAARGRGHRGEGTGRGPRPRPGARAARPPSTPRTSPGPGSTSRARRATASSRSSARRAERGGPAGGGPRPTRAAVTRRGQVRGSTGVAAPRWRRYVRSAHR
jgi:hypothetical protein